MGALRAGWLSSMCITPSTTSRLLALEPPQPWHGEASRADVAVGVGGERPPVGCHRSSESRRGGDGSSTRMQCDKNRSAGCILVRLGFHASAFDPSSFSGPSTPALDALTRALAYLVEVLEGPRVSGIAQLALAEWRRRWSLALLRYRRVEWICLGGHAACHVSSDGDWRILRENGCRPRSG